MKTEKGIGVDGIGNTGLSINVRDTAMNFEILKDKIDEDDLGESETLFEWQGNNFLEFMEYLHENYKEIQETIDSGEYDDIYLRIPAEQSGKNINYLSISFERESISFRLMLDASFIGKENEDDKKAFQQIRDIVSDRTNAYRKPEVK